MVIVVLYFLGQLAWTVLDLPRAPGGKQVPMVGRFIQEWAFSAEAGDHLTISDVTDFGWDRVLFVAAYASDKDPREQLGFSWNVDDWTSSNEGSNLIGFVSGQRVVVWTSMSAWMNPLKGLENEGGMLLLSRDEAVLVRTSAGLECDPT